MLTPPASPQPKRSASSYFPSSSSTSSLSSRSDNGESVSPDPEEHKRTTGRRTRWAVILVPCILIFITLSTRYITHPVIFDVMNDPDMVWVGMHQSVHKRHPAEAGTQPTNLQVANPAATPSTSPQSLPTLPSAPPTLPTPFPQAFDSDIGQNFSTGSCQFFFSNMTNAQSFRSCRPFSLLADDSQEFMDAQGNLTLMNSLIWGTCNTTLDEATCTANMNSYASQLKTECAQEIKDQNSLVLRAVASLQAYDLMRKSACLVDQTTNSYCYLSAVMNPNPSDLYFYNLPHGIFLPNTTKPSCSACTKSIMAQYALALSDQYPDGSPKVVDDTAPLAGLKKTYGASAILTQNNCGPAYASTVSASTTGDAIRVSGSGRTVYLVMAVTLLSVLGFSHY